jgi:hypothetical protein
VNRLVNWTPAAIASHVSVSFRVRHAWSSAGAGLQELRKRPATRIPLDGPPGNVKHRSVNQHPIMTSSLDAALNESVVFDAG